MLTRVYGLLWAVLAVLIGVTFATGNLSPKMVVIFGFFVLGLIYMGMISVLPFWASHPPSPRH